MSFRARVFDNLTGAFLLECRVTGATLAEAESRAIAKAALTMRGDPEQMNVRYLNEMRDAHAECLLTAAPTEERMAR